MMKATFCVLVFSMYIALCAGACPLEGCTDDIKPASCRAVSFFVHEGEVCQSCDLCVEKSNANGCPPRKCNRKHIPDNCRREMYYVYQGGKICKDCPRDTCQY